MLRAAAAHLVVLRVLAAPLDLPVVLLRVELALVEAAFLTE